jgi:hypothetical protein
MKTSKIIFISLISVIAFLILISFVDIKLNSMRHQNTIVNRQALSSFKVIYINNSNLDLVQNDSSFLETICLKDSIMPRMNYSVKGDTLMVSDIRQSNKRPGYPLIRICSNDSLKSIILKNSDINLKDFRSAKMNLIMDGSYVVLNQNEKIVSPLRSLDILARNHSNINSNKFKIENLVINLQKSEAYLSIVASKINGILLDSSRVNINLSGEVSMKSDSTSTVNLNEN